MGKARSVFTNNNIIHRSRESTKNAAIERRFGNGAKPAQPTVTKANTTRYDNNKGTILPLGDVIHNIGSPSKRFNQVYTGSVRLDNSRTINFGNITGITYDTGSGASEVHDFRIDGTAVMLIQSDRVDIRQDIINSSVTARDIGTTSAPWANIYLNEANIRKSTTHGPDLILENTDGSISAGNDVAEIYFKAEDDGGTTENYARIEVIANSITNGGENAYMNFWVKRGAGDLVMRLNSADLEVEIDGGYTIKSRTSTEIGFQVTNETISIGTEGTLQIPHISGSSGTAAAADADFGDVEGCMGIYTNTTSNTHTLVVRQDDGNWAGVILSDNTLT